MGKRKIIPFLALPLLFVLITNFTFASSLSFYYESLKFKTFYNLTKLLPDPINKISYLNALMKTTLTTYLKLPTNQKQRFFKNYLTVLLDLKKNWANFSFSYSQYENFYKKSLELYILHLITVKKEVKNKTAERYLTEIIATLISKIDNKTGVEFVEKLVNKHNVKLQEFQSKEEGELLKNIKFADLLQAMKDFKNLVEEFEKGERIITDNYELVEKKILGIQNEIKDAQNNIKKFKVEEFNKNIERIKENLDFIIKNSKKIK